MNKKARASEPTKYLYEQNIDRSFIKLKRKENKRNETK